jgi:DNA adenine methylase
MSIVVTRNREKASQKETHDTVKVIVPPIKSQGIKTKLVPWILAQLPDRKGRWIEPFMGTGVVGFNAAFASAWMGDINPHLVKFYSALQSQEITPEIVDDYLTREGRALAQAGDKGYDHYRLVRSRFNTGKGDPLDFLFLNRAGFNGMIRFSKNGWNIPFCQKPNRFIGMLKTKIVNQVIRVQGVIEKDWRFSCGDFRGVIQNAGVDDIIYCDPPYHGRHTDYFTKWTDKEEEELAQLLKATKAKFILSTWHNSDYRINESIPKYWSEYKILKREHFYHAGAKETNRRPIIEALIMNFEPPPARIEEVEVEDEEAEPALATSTEQLSFGL